MITCYCTWELYFSKPARLVYQSVVSGLFGYKHIKSGFHFSVLKPKLQ